jgi:hypothetical protein
MWNGCNKESDVQNQEETNIKVWTGMAESCIFVSKSYRYDQNRLQQNN